MTRNLTPLQRERHLTGGYRARRTGTARRQYLIPTPAARGSIVWTVLTVGAVGGAAWVFAAGMGWL